MPMFKDDTGSDSPFSLDEIDLDRVRRGCRERWERLEARVERGPVTAS